MTATKTPRPTGVYAASITPFTDDLEPDAANLIRHCRWLLANGCDGVAPFGTTGEGTSLSADQRIPLLEALVGAGLPADRMIPGTGAPALADAVRLTATSVRLGFAGALALPPYYYKNPSEDGLFGFFSEVVQRVGDARLRLYLYHFPQMSAVPITLGLIERLLKAYPQTIAGLKDSSGDWDNTARVIDAFPGFGVFSGSEQFLLQNLRRGGVGCISATVNLTAPLAQPVYASWRDAEAERLQQALSEARLALQRFPLVAALKQVAARVTGDRGWLNLIPPLSALSEQQAGDLMAALERLPQVAPLIVKRAQAA